MQQTSSRTGRIFLMIAVAVVFYAALALVVGGKDLRHQVHLFPLSAVPLLVALSVANYVLRFLRWEIYRRKLSIRIATTESLALFMATLAMVITPGKIGEVYKAGYLLERHRVPLATGLPILVSERIFDFLAVLLLAGLGLAAWHGPLSSLKLSFAVALLVPLLLLVLRSDRARRRVLAWSARSPYARRHEVSLAGALDQLRLLSGIRIGAAALALSILAWAAECGSLWLVCRALGSPIRIGEAAFVYAAATLAGSLFFLPGGLGGTEGTLILLLSDVGMQRGLAVTVALVVRLATLWLAVGIGLLVFAAGRHLFLAPSRAPEPGHLAVSGDD